MRSTKLPARTAPRARMCPGKVSREIFFPIVEGSTVTTKYGPVKTDHILFIAAGAFHTVKPSDLIPELQGRFPIRVELDALGRERVCQNTDRTQKCAYSSIYGILKTEGVDVVFEDEAVEEIAKIAEEVNNLTENIGARRLHTVMECLLEDILFDAPDMEEKRVVIDKEYVEDKLKDIKEDEDLSRYIL